MLTAFLLISVCMVAFTNGANANFKGVASLYGSGTTTLKLALAWGTLTTFAGSLAAVVISGGLISKFQGKGLVPDTLVQSPEFLCAVALGAAMTSFLATRLGFPVSTTHALVGALIGAGLAGQASVNVAALWNTFLVPLIFSPVIAFFLGGVTYWLLRLLRLVPDHRTPLLDSLHYFSTGAASFARGLNDTPKMAPLLLALPQFSTAGSIVVVAIMIALGGILDARRVAETLGKKITNMNPGQGFAASLVTAGLVTTASFHGLPASTTHVSVGSLLGMGASTRQAHWKKAGEILIAWISTVPCGAILAAVAFWVISRL